MAALTDNRDTPEIEGRYTDQDAQTILDAEIMYAGGMVARDYNGEVQMASDTVGLRVLGRAPEKVDNTDDGETIDPAEHGRRR